jgi:hypothetical protein
MTIYGYPVSPLTMCWVSAPAAPWEAGGIAPFNGLADDKVFACKNGGKTVISGGVSFAEIIAESSLIHFATIQKPPKFSFPGLAPLSHRFALCWGELKNQRIAH